MANPDVRRDTEAAESSIEQRGPSPEIVYMPESFDLGAFPSEDPADSTVDTAPPPQEVPVAAVSIAAEPAVDPTPVAAPQTHDEPQVAATFASEEPPVYAAEPAPVLEFSARPSAAKPSAPDVIADSDEPLTLLQVLDSGGRVSWREAVAIVHQLCMQLKDVPSHAPVLIEPGSIQIAASGQLRLLSNQQGGDPLVIQLGRLLGSMLSMESVPSELRLLVSQATFELAIFESVEHFSQALAKLSGPSDNDCVKAAFGRAAHHSPPKIESSLLLQPPVTLPERPIVTQSAQPSHKTAFQRQTTERVRRIVLNLAAPVLLAGLGIAGFLLLKGGTSRTVTPPRLSAPDLHAPPTTPSLEASASLPVEVPKVSGTTGARRVVKLPEVEHAGRPIGRPPTTRPPTPVPRSDTRPADAPDAPLVTPSILPRPPSGSAATESPGDLVHRANTLYVDGKPSDAAIVLDLLVMTAPLYDPSPGELSPDVLSAFHASQHSMLPNIAARELDKATAALAAGDIDHATSGSARVAAMLDRYDPDGVSPLRSRLDLVTRRAGAARNVAENTIYGRGDADVIPPVPLSRQFPEGIPSGVPPGRVGTLEMIIGKTGDVEFVKLHTPLNRYHERMIVSAVKAWRYRPATKAGNPVKFRLTISINLPESPAGTW